MRENHVIGGKLMPNFVDNTKECWGRDRSIIVTPHKYHIKVKCLKVDITEGFQQTITFEKHFSLLIFYEEVWLG